MFENIIEFSAHEDYVNIKENYPKPIKTNIPEWFKKLKHNKESRTVKGCIPFLQTLTTGYLLTLPQSIHLKHNVVDEANVKTEMRITSNIGEYVNLNTHHPQLHPPFQVAGSPHLKKNNDLPVQKILNPWHIKTPRGYSCLFLPPLNNTDDRFSIIPGIVDTDTLPVQVNFPFIVNGDKYPMLDTIIEIGTPYVQIIPFKRESWQMKIKKQKKKDHVSTIKKFFLTDFHRYKNNYWIKDIKWK
tara:strand:- start:1297 stop:2025 length:729 start_codon:yes stop_codon:yes gene_type:complete